MRSEDGVVADRPDDVGEPDQVVAHCPVLVGEQTLKVLPGLGELPDRERARLVGDVVEVIARTDQK